MRKIEIKKSDNFRDAQIVVTENPAQTSVTHLTWEELETIVNQGQELLRRRSVDWSCGLTEDERAAIRRGEDIDYHEDLD